MNRKFQIDDVVCSRTVCDMWERATVVGYEGHGYYTVKPDTGTRRPYLAHATNMRKAENGIRHNAASHIRKDISDE